MRICRIKDTEVRCQLFLFAIIPLAILLGRGDFLPIAFVALSMHELAHAAVAERLGYCVEAIEIQPFGFVARLSCADALPKDAIAIYFAGPLASIFVASVAALLTWLLPNIKGFSEEFISYNLVIAAVNLLPALPLDGGRILFGIACGGRSEKKAASMLTTAGIATGLIFVLISTGMLFYDIINPTFLIMGLFLVIAAKKERKTLLLNRELMKRRRGNRLAASGSIGVRQCAMRADASIADALAAFPGGSYGMVIVVDSNFKRVGTLDEGQLIEAATVFGSYAKLSSALSVVHAKNAKF